MARNNPAKPDRKILYPSLIILCCFILYGNTLQNGYALDDGIYTNRNVYILKGFSAIRDIFDKGSLYGYNKDSSTQYRPFTMLVFMAEVSAFGLNPHAGHFMNVLLFCVTCILLWFFLQKILKNYNPAVIFASTLLFVFHPIHTEVVANIKSQDELLGLLFGLVSFYCLFVHLENKKNSYYYYSCTAFFISVFCKENCLAFAAIVPLLLYFFTSPEVKKITLKTLPYIGIILVYLFIRSRVLQSLTFTKPIPLMDNALMAATNSADAMATAFVMLGKYIYLTIIPYPLSWDYSYNQIPIVSWGNVSAIISLLVCLALAVYVLWGVRKKNINSFLVAWFFITIFLSSNIVIKIASTFAERFLYVPSLAFCIAVPVMLAKIKTRNFYAVIAGILVIYSLVTIPRNADWKDNFTLFSAGVITSPNSARAHISLSMEYVQQLKTARGKEAQRQLEDLCVQENYKAISINHNYTDAFYNLGKLYKAMGWKDSSITCFQKALRISPDDSDVRSNLDIMLRLQNRH